MNDNRERLREMMRDAGCEKSWSRLSSALHWPVECDAAAWSTRMLAVASSELERHALRVWRRQIAVVVLLALVTLPLTLLSGGYVVSFAYGLLCGVVPTGVATYLVSTYALVALGLLGLFYAMIPIAVGQSRDRMVLALVD